MSQTQNSQTSRIESIQQRIQCNILCTDFLPEPFENVIVCCEQFSCLGYVDKRNLWRNAHSGDLMEGRVLGWSR